MGIMVERLAHFSPERSTRPVTNFSDILNGPRIVASGLPDTLTLPDGVLNDPYNFGHDSTRRPHFHPGLSVITYNSYRDRLIYGDAIGMTGSNRETSRSFVTQLATPHIVVVDRDYVPTAEGQNGTKPRVASPDLTLHPLELASLLTRPTRYGFVVMDGADKIMFACATKETKPTAELQQRAARIGKPREVQRIGAALGATEVSQDMMRAFNLAVYTGTRGHLNGNGYESTTLTRLF